MRKRSAKRGARRGRRASTTITNVILADELRKGRSQTDLARELAKGNPDRLDSKKQRVRRASQAMQDGIEMPSDPEHVSELLRALDEIEPSDGSELERIVPSTDD